MKLFEETMKKVEKYPLLKYSLGIVIFFAWIWIAFFVIEMLQGGVKAFRETMMAVIGLFFVFLGLAKQLFLWLYYNGIVGIAVLIFLVYVLAKKMKKLVRLLASKRKQK